MTDTPSKLSSPEELRRRIEGVEWYHTIEIAPGIETPGWFDLRPVADKVLPASLAGKRCLDIATFDGFWALQMEARGASEVMAIDILDPRKWDWPSDSTEASKEAVGARKQRGEGFELVTQMLGSNIERREQSVYDLDPDEVGQFDFIYFGSLLLHLRDPVRALERARAVCSGEMLLVDSFDQALTLLHPRRALAYFDGRGRPWWWEANIAGLKRMVESASFEITKSPQRIKMPAGRGQHKPPLRLGSLRTRGARTAVRDALFGDPHVALSARPVSPAG